MDVNDSALTTFAAMLFDGIVLSNFGPVTVCGYSVAVLLERARDLSVDEGSYFSVLINYPKDLAINFDDASDC